MEEKNYGWLTPFEATTLMQRESKRPNGVGVTGIVLGSAALLTAAGAWIFGGCFANSKAKANTDLILLNANHQNQITSLLASNIAAERSERVAQQITRAVCRVPFSRVRTCVYSLLVLRIAVAVAVAISMV